MPDGSGDHRPPRKGIFRQRLYSARALQRHRLRGVFRHAVGEQGEKIRHRQRQRQRAPVDAAAVYLRRLAFRSLSEIDDARQGRQLYVAERRRDVSQSLDQQIRDDGRNGGAGGQGEISFARSPRGRGGDSGQTGMLPRGGVSQTAFPARRTVGQPAAGRRSAGTGEGIKNSATTCANPFAVCVNQTYGRRKRQTAEPE